jgi:hypothetical protein
VKNIKIIEKKLGRERAWGQAWQSEFIVEIDPRQSSKKYLNTLIHEILHCLYPENSETKIKNNADILTKHIWDKNYRRIQK